MVWNSTQNSYLGRAGDRDVKKSKIKISMFSIIRPALLYDNIEGYLESSIYSVSGVDTKTLSDIIFWEIQTASSCVQNISFDYTSLVID